MSDSKKNAAAGKPNISESGYPTTQDFVKPAKEALKQAEASQRKLDAHLEKLEDLLQQG